MKKAALFIVILFPLCAPAAETGAGPEGWPERITIQGDLRLREELTRREGADSRNRVRLRARLSVEARLNEDIKAGIGINSGSDDPTSSNQTFGEQFSHKPIRLDLAYAEWSPAIIREAGFGKLTMIGGKMRNPFIVVDELVWDSDVNPEGFAGRVLVSPSGALDLAANGGAMWYYERSSGPETMLYTGQLAFRLKNEKGCYLLAGATLYWFANVEGNGAFDWENNNNFYGNTSRKVVSNGVTNDVYACDFHEWEGFVECGARLPALDLPVKIFGNCINNAAAADFAAGYQAGIQLNELNDRNSFMLGYAWRELQADATMGAMTDADWWGGGTNGKGHRLQAGYQIYKNWNIIASYFFNNVANLNTDPQAYQRMQVDLNARF